MRPYAGLVFHSTLLSEYVQVMFKCMPMMGFVQLQLHEVQQARKH
jgi:hypothetical protein